MEDGHEVGNLGTGRGAQMSFCSHGGLKPKLSSNCQVWLWAEQSGYAAENRSPAELTTAVPTSCPSRRCSLRLLSHSSRAEEAKQTPRAHKASSPTYRLQEKLADSDLETAGQGSKEHITSQAENRCTKEGGRAGSAKCSGCGGNLRERGRLGETSRVTPRFPLM